MELSFQTTHAVNEVTKLRYDMCMWFPEPKKQDGLVVYGMIEFQRQKNKKKDASRVSIPITAQLKRIIDESRDGVRSPYIVHAVKKQTNDMPKGCTHRTQLTNRYIQDAYSALRDKLGLYDHLSKPERPTFHEIRSLSITFYENQGVKATKRAAHSNRKSTTKYKEGHVKVNKVKAAELGTYNLNSEDLGANDEPDYD